MLSFTHSGLGRRHFLRVGSLGLGGLCLPELLAKKALASKAGKPISDKSVIFLFMHGGPAQTETFDPKMTAPSGVRSATGEVKTSLPGVTFGGTFEKLAKVAHRLAVVRSFVTGDGDHNIKPVVGKATAQANLGSLYARVAGMNDPATGMPRNVAVFPRAVDPNAEPAQTSFGKFDSTGTLGRAYAPFVLGSGGDFQQDLRLAFEQRRLDDRRGLLKELDGLRRKVDATDSMAGTDHFQQQAFDMIVRGVGQAFDLSREDPRTVAMYDTAPLMSVDSISRKWNNWKYYRDNAQTLGKLLLLARRLCEAGCGFVTVTTNFVWDMHADINNATMTEGMGYVGAPFDHAVAAFLRDVEARGLSDKILLVACGEMGRTPKINGNGGRDHWGGLAPLILAGGGLRMGQVIGESSPDAAEPAANPVRIENLIATVMGSLLDVPSLRATTHLPEDLLRAITAAEPIPGL